MKVLDNFLNDGFVMTSTHEPLVFLRRIGRVHVNSLREWDALHTEEVVMEMKARGLTVMRFHFHKGFGYEHERQDRELASKFIALCHKHGLKVQVYIAFQSAVAETASVENADYEDWVMRDEHGLPLNLWFNHQNFRNLPCLNRDGFWNNLKLASHAAIVESKADAIGYDNVSWSVEPVVCHCDVCKKEFVEFMKKRYPTKEEAIDRFGHDKIENIGPPRWNYYANHLNLTEIIQPVLQEWIEFKTSTLKKRIDEMYKYCKSLREDVVVEINASMQTGQNSAFYMGIYENDLATGCDAFWNEVDPAPGYHNGQLLHKARIFKAHRAMGKMVFTGHPWGDPSPNARLLAVAENMAFQYGSVNCISMFDQYKLRDNEDLLHVPLANFSRANRKMYSAEPVAYAYLYESRPSMCYSNFESQYAGILMNQTLLREKIPYAILHDLNNIDHCQVIILPGAICLSEKEIDALLAYVKKGGGLVLTGNTGDFNENYRGLKERSLKSRLGVADKAAPCSISFGEGRVAVLPRLTSKHDFPTYNWAYDPFEESQVRVKFESWEAPADMHRVSGAIKWAANYALPVTVEGPESLVCELTKDGNTQYLHLLNYDYENVAKGVLVTIQGGVKQAKLINPLTGESKELAVIGGNSIAVDKVPIYMVVELH